MSCALFTSSLLISLTIHTTSATNQNWSGPSIPSPLKTCSLFSLAIILLGGLGGDGGGGGGVGEVWGGGWGVRGWMDRETQIHPNYFQPLTLTCHKDGWGNISRLKGYLFLILNSQQRAIVNLNKILQIYYI